MYLLTLLLVEGVRGKFTYGSTSSQDPLPACDLEVLCNGVVCSDVCTDGSLRVDPWLISTLEFQRNLTTDRPLSQGPHFGTHNALISKANGFGLEEDFASAVYTATNPSVDASHVRIPNQRFGLTDLLNLGVRHVEYDIWDVPNVNGTLDFEIHLCHSPVPDPGGALAMEEAAIALGLGPIDWNPVKSLCSNLTLEWAMLKTQAWLEAHPNEVIGAYLDNRVAPWNADLITQTLKKVWKSALMTPSDFFTLFNGTRGDSKTFPSRTAMLAAGKRIYVESNSYVGTNFTPTTLPEVAFYPTTWDDAWFGGGQPGPLHVTPFPNCTIAGASPGWYGGSQWPRFLDGGDLQQSPSEADITMVQQPEGLQDLVACAVPTIGVAAVTPVSAKAWAWSWGEGEPAAGAGCMAAAVSQVRGRWAAKPCTTLLPVLCMRGDNRLTPLGGDSGAWNITRRAVSFGAAAQAECQALGSGWGVGLPRDARENAWGARLALLGGLWGSSPGYWVGHQVTGLE